MKRVLMVTVSSLALVGSAIAADKPIYAKAPSAPLAPNWTGPYAGLNIGAVQTRSHNLTVDDGGVWFDTVLRKTGLTIGGQIGQNWQHNNHLLGLEADFNWANARTSRLIDSPVLGPLSAEASSRMNWYGTARVRAGVLLTPSTLVFATGGLAVSDLSSRTSRTNGFFQHSSPDTRWGWVAGGGIEHQLAGNYTIKVEALYLDFGRKTDSNTPVGSSYVGRFKNSAIVGRVGVNVRW